MVDLTKEEIRAMGHAVGLEIEDPELTEVMYSLNALLEALDQINPPGLEKRRALAHHYAPQSGWIREFGDRWWLGLPTIPKRRAG